MTTRRIALAVFAAALAFLALHSAHAADAPRAADAPKRPVIAVTNNYSAYAAAVDSVALTKSEQCSSKTGALQTMAGKCASDMCLAYFADKVLSACGGQGSGQEQPIQVAAPAPEKSWFAEVKDTVFELGRTAFPFVDRMMSSRERRDATASAERQNLGLYATFGQIHGQTIGGMTTLGTAGLAAVQNTATAGFGSIERTAAAAFANQRDTYTINLTGNDNNLFGSSSVRNYSNQCTGAPGGNSSSTTGNPAGGQSGQVPCTISK